MTTATENGAGIGFQVSLQAALGQLAGAVSGMGDTLHKIHRLLTANRQQSILVRPLRGAVVGDGSTYIYIDLGGPAGGRVWDLRRLVVYKGGGADLSSAVANVIVSVFVRLGQGTFNQVGGSNVFQIDDAIVIGSTANNPYSNTWSAHEATIVSGQRFVVALKATSNNDNWVASGQAVEYFESADEEVQA